MFRLQLCLALVALAACVAAQTPQRPVIPEDFLAVITFQMHTSEGTVDGEGHWANDYSGGKQVQHFELRNTAHKDHPVDEFRLLRYDMKMMYEYAAPLNTTHGCNHLPLNGTMEKVWGWLAEASYAGKKEIRHVAYDIWSLRVPETKSTVEVAVEDSMRNRPAFMNTTAPTGDAFYDFHDFQPKVPEASAFTIPKECQ